MQKSPALRKASQIYLTIIPPVAFILAFAIGHVSYHIYLPIWIIHACIMITAAWILGAQMVRSQDPIPKFSAVISIFLILPWLFISIFAGMGPPPSTIAGWVDNATEQQIRYLILVAGGIFLAIGLTLLKEKLRQTGELIYSNIGAAAVRILTPLYIINMIFWGFFLTASFKIFMASDAPAKRPDWYTTTNLFFYVVSIVELALTYLATAAFAKSLKATGIFRPLACNIYIAFSLFGFACCLIPSYAPGPLGVIGYVSSIPAVAFIMPYLIGINFLKQAGKS